MTTGIEPDRRHIKQDASFVPISWEGIRGIVLKTKWKDELPAASEPKARPVNPRLYEHVHKEFKRLCTYMYVPHDGPYAAPLVIAHKATSPFRFERTLVAHDNGASKVLMTGSEFCNVRPRGRRRFNLSVFRT